MPKRVPVTTFMTADRVPMFAVSTLCGQSWAGMVLSNDMAVQMRRALSHAEDCELCEQRWAVLNGG